MSDFKLQIDEWGENSYVQGVNYDQNTDSYVGHRADNDTGQAHQDVEFITTDIRGNKLGKINVESGGHGSSTGMYIDDDGIYEMWFGHDKLACSGYVRFKRNESGTKSFVRTDLPEGDIEIDQVNNRLILRNGNRYRIYKLDSVRSNSAHNRIKVADFTIPHRNKRWQGMYLAEGRLFVHRDVETKGTSHADMFDVSGTLPQDGGLIRPIKTWNTTNMGDEAEGFMGRSKGDKVEILVIKRTGPSGRRRIIEGTLIISLPKLKTPWDGKTFPGADAFVIGSRHPAVTVLGERLEAHGWTGYKNGPGIPMSETDKAGVRWWQLKQGWTGTGADGIPGPRTWETLMEKPKPTPPKPDPKPEVPEVPTLPAYYPPADRTSQWYPNIAGGATFTKVDKLVIHTTEGSGWHNYGATGFGPHMTWWRQWRQHIPLTKSATALTDPASTPVRENRDNVIQIELVGFAKNAGNMDDNTVEALAQFIAFLHKYGLPLNIMTVWTGPNTHARMTSAEFDAFKGVCGHQHVSGNDHWDPGQIPWNVIIDRAKEIVNGPVKVDPPKPAPPVVIPPTTKPPYMTDEMKFPGAAAFVIGSPHPAVAILGQRLVAHGWKYKIGPGTPMGTADVKGTQWFQGLQGWDGSGADGIPGKLTWEALMKTPKVRPTPPTNGRPIHNGTVGPGFKAKGGWAWSQGHPGEDWNAPGDDFGNNVFAVRSGVVKYIGRLPWDQKSGNSFGDKALVIQDDVGTYQTLYAHMSAVYVRLGQRVQVGDVVGAMGFSGNVIPANRQGTHLHVERRKFPYRYGTDVVKPVYGD